MIPGCRRNWFRTSTTTWEAARPTARIGERREQERHRAADQEPDQDVGLVDPDPVEDEAGAAQRLLERTEQRRGGQDRGGDGHALGDGLGGVAHRVQAAQDLRGPALELAGHLRDALRVVRDGAVRVHGDHHAHRGEHAHAGERDEVEALGCVVPPR